MGFFSYQCRGCKHPMLSEHATNGINGWMQDTVVVDKDKGVVAEGHYDGYGRIPSVELGEVYRLTYDEKTGDCMEAVWHNACWKKAAEPAFDKPSKSASDQGYFFDPGDHDMAEPAWSRTWSEPVSRFFFEALELARNGRPGSALYVLHLALNEQRNQCATEYQRSGESSEWNGRTVLFETLETFVNRCAVVLDSPSDDVVDAKKYCDCNMPADHFYEDGKVACEECHKWGDHRPTAFYERSLN